MKIHAKAELTARSVRKFGDKKKAAYVADAKAPGIVQLESNLEATGLAVCSIDSRITHVRTQPFAIDLLSGRKYASQKEMAEHFKGSRYSPKLYYPDFLVFLRNGSEVFLEIKHTGLIEENPDIMDRPAIFADFGMRLLIVTEQVLTDAFAHNARMLRPYSMQACGDTDRAQILSLTGSAVCIGEVKKRGIAQAAIFKAILDGTVSADLQQKRLSPKTVLRPADSSTAHLEILPL